MSPAICHINTRRLTAACSRRHVVFSIARGLMCAGIPVGAARCKSPGLVFEKVPRSRNERYKHLYPQAITTVLSVSKISFERKIVFYKPFSDILPSNPQALYQNLPPLLFLEGNFRISLPREKAQLGLSLQPTVWEAPTIDTPGGASSILLSVRSLMETPYMYNYLDAPNRCQHLWVSAPRHYITHSMIHSLTWTARDAFN